MSKPQIYAKAIVEENNIAIKEKIGCDGIEIQLMCELLKNNELGSYYYVEEVMNLKTLLDHNICVVHAPLFSYKGVADINLEQLCDSFNFKLLDQVCYLANTIGKSQNKSILIVVHSEEHKENLKMLSDGWKRVLNGIGCMLFKYTYIEFGLENVSPLRVNKQNEYLHLNNNWGFDNVEIVKALREQLHTERIGTVLDTCHATISEKIATLLSSNYEEYIDKSDFTIENYFKKNKPYIKLIHLSDTIGNGYGKGKHGMPFTEDSANTLYRYLDLYENMKLDCPITLEVAEEDYLVCDGYRKTKELVDGYYRF